MRIIPAKLFGAELKNGGVRARPIRKYRREVSMQLALFPVYLFGKGRELPSTSEYISFVPLRILLLSFVVNPSVPKRFLYESKTCTSYGV